MENLGRKRRWGTTLNNWTQEEYDVLKDFIEAKCSHGIIGKERGEQENTPHLQYCYELRNGMTFSAVKKKIGPRHHIEPIRNYEQAVEYCKKEGDFWEFGEEPEGQGNRTDLKDIHEALLDGATVREIIPSVKSYQGIQFALKWLTYLESPRTWKPNVRWYWGEAGSGKTKAAFEESDDAKRWVTSKNIKWFDGYDGHEHVILDDFRADWCPLEELLRLLDRYEYRVEIKGSFRQFKATDIWITSPRHPRDLSYGQTEDIKQLIRRIDCIKEFKGL